MVSVYLDILETGAKSAATMNASGKVIAARTSPNVSTDELARMVPEKIDAFSASGSVLAAGFWSMQSAWLAEAHHASATLWQGRPLTLSDMAAQSSRTAEFVLSAVEAASTLSSRSLAPIHRKATSNARRLGSVGAARRAR